MQPQRRPVQRVPVPRACLVCGKPVVKRYIGLCRIHMRAVPKPDRIRLWETYDAANSAASRLAEGNATEREVIAAARAHLSLREAAVKLASSPQPPAARRPPPLMRPPENQPDTRIVGGLPDRCTICGNPRDKPYAPLCPDHLRLANQALGRELRATFDAYLAEYWHVVQRLRLDDKAAVRDLGRLRDRYEVTMNKVYDAISDPEALRRQMQQFKREKAGGAA